MVLETCLIGPKRVDGSKFDPLMGSTVRRNVKGKLAWCGSNQLMGWIEVWKTGDFFQRLELRWSRKVVRVQILLLLTKNQKLIYIAKSKTRSQVKNY